MEVFNMLPIGTRCEVIDNALYMSTSQTTDHQRISMRISAQLEVFTFQSGIGETFAGPCDVYLNNGDVVVQPDILFVKSERKGIIELKGIMGAPDLAIEILSSNVAHDTERKLRLYEQNLVPEYFIIDPQTKDVLHYLLVSDTYYLQPGVKAGQLYIRQLDLTINF